MKDRSVDGGDPGQPPRIECGPPLSGIVRLCMPGAGGIWEMAVLSRLETEHWSR